MLGNLFFFKFVTYRWVVGLLGGSRSEGRSNCTVGVEAFVYGVRACTGKAGV